MKKSRKVFCILNPNLKDLLGHYFEYSYSLMKIIEKRGYEFLVLTNKEAETSVTEKLPVKKVFSKEIWHVRPSLCKSHFGRKVNTILENVRYYLIIRRILNKEIVTPDWVIFCDTLCHNQMMAWAWWINYIPKHKRPRLILLFRYSSSWFDFWSDHKTMSKVFKMFKKAALGERLILCSDSSRLKKEYARFTDLPIYVVPIPHTSHPILLGDSRVTDYSNERPLRIGSLGGARDEKGYIEILETIKIINKKEIFRRFEFLIQASGAALELLEATKEVEAMNLQNVRFIYDVLDSEEYYKLLQNIDVVLLPYWRSIYESRTSGILTESLAAGKPVIATLDTWMSDQLQAYDTGLTCRDRDPEDLARAIIEMYLRKDEFRAKAIRAKDRWLFDHNPEALLEVLLAPRII